MLQKANLAFKYITARLISLEELLSLANVVKAEVIKSTVIRLLLGFGSDY